MSNLESAAASFSADHAYEEYLAAYGNYSSENMSDYSIGYNFMFKFDLWEHYLKPEPKQWIVLFCYLLVFIVSLTGNLLIVIFIIRRKSLHTTVNYFMLNLALADTLVTIIALPSTLAVDIFETWIFGWAMCKLTPYLQMTVTSVSTLSLGAIAINRWFVVCYPLKVTELKNATKTAIGCMVAIWVVSLATICPVVVVHELSCEYDVELYPELKSLQACKEAWETHNREAAFHLYYFIMCYAFPLIVLAATYSMVFRELSKAKIPGYFVTKKKRGECLCGSTKKGSESSFLLKPRSSSSRSMPTSPTTPTFPTQQQMWRNDDEAFFGKCSSFSTINEEDRPLKEDFEEKPQSKICFTRKLYKSLSLLSCRKSSKRGTCRKCSAKMALLQSRRRSAIMQVTLIAVFGVCYGPAMILDVLRHVFDCFHDSHRGSAYFGFSVAHLIMYLNSALNPIIYNFFSSQFRKEFRNTFSCFFKHGLRRKMSTFSTSYFVSKWDKSRGGTFRSTLRTSQS